VSLHLLWAPDLKSVFASIDDLAIIIDYKGIITEINHPKRLETLLGNNLETLEELMSKLRNKTSKSSHAGLETRLLKMNCKEQFEIHFIEEAADYLFSLTPIVAGKSHLGATIVMYNITEKKNSEQQMKILNNYLENANRKLSDYVKIASVLEAEKERLSLLEQVQRDLVYKIEMAIAYVHHIQITRYDSMPAYKKDIAKIADMLRDVYRDVRNSILRISRKERG
jgi:hypothetical protein